jgi:predicted RecA/RadA family phage recombinase
MKKRLVVAVIGSALMALSVYAEVQATFIQSGSTVAYTLTTDVAAGTVIVQNDLVGVANGAIASNTVGVITVDGVFDVNQAAEIIPAGSPVYWDTNGTSVAGTAGTGAATATPTGNTFMGFAISTTAADDDVVRVVLRSTDSSSTGYIAATNAQAAVDALEVTITNLPAASVTHGNLGVGRITNALGGTPGKISLTNVVNDVTNVYTVVYIP